MCNLQGEEQGETRNVKVPLSSEQAHMSLHLGIKMGGMACFTSGCVTVFVHFTDGILKVKEYIKFNMCA